MKLDRNIVRLNPGSRRVQMKGFGSSSRFIEWRLDNLIYTCKVDGKFSIDEMSAWCEQNTTGYFSFQIPLADWYVVYFSNEDDCLVFKLTWSGK